MTDHSAFEKCPAICSCSKCHNNLVDPRGFTLMLTPKVASQSVLEAYIASGPHMVRWSSKKFVVDHCQNHYKVGLIRNPFSRLVSCWQNKCIDLGGYRTFHYYGLTRGMGFEAFARTIVGVPDNEADKHWRAMCFDMLDDNYLAIPNVFVKLENMGLDWGVATDKIKQVARVQLQPLRHTHKSDRGPWREYYTPELIDLVGNYYHKDLITFDYSFDSKPLYNQVNNGERYGIQ